MTEYTKGDLESALQVLKSAQDRWRRYDGGSPEKFHNQLIEARSRVQEISEYLEARGITADDLEAEG